MNKLNVALKIKAKHGYIYDFMLNNNKTAKQMAGEIGVSQATFNKIINFKWTPSDAWQTLKIVQKIEQYFNESIAILFPPCIYDKLKNNKEIAKYLQNEKVLFKDMTELELLSIQEAPAEQMLYDQDLDKYEMKNVINDVLMQLSEREERIIRKRFYEDMTLDEIATSEGVTRETIRRIEDHALRNLRSPYLSKRTKDFILSGKANPDNKIAYRDESNRFRSVEELEWHETGRLASRR